jgi:hypothetical protein
VPRAVGAAGGEGREWGSEGVVEKGPRNLKWPDQNAFGRPACRKMALAVWRLGIPTGTGKFRRVIGLYQISWLPLPWRTKVHPAARSSSRSARSNCGAI